MSDPASVQQPGPSADHPASPAADKEPPAATPVPRAPEPLGPSRTENLDLLKGLFLAVLVTAMFYEVFPIPFIDAGRLLQVFDNWVSELIVGLALWSLFLLLFKYLDYRWERRAREALELEAIRAVFAKGVYARSVDEVLANLHTALAAVKLKRPRQSVAVRRVERVLHYIRAVPKRESINDLLDFQAQIDVKRLESSYAILQVFIWAIPILGFIGTVLGIGNSVNSFADFIQTAEAGAAFGAQMRTALGQVTNGLAVAFNTTFLALVLVVPVMMITSLLQKNEEENLLSVEEYCLEKLLPRLHVTPADALTEGYDEHMHRILSLSQTWLTQFEPVVQQLTRQTELITNQLAGVQPIVRAFTDKLLGGTAGGAPAEPERAAAAAKPPTA
ncbi:MAG: MotA/TolQ/ExbB proton channel family protein [Candidatus Lambdaproteobacteria bacterium]|nr:MotA/TolQ/ExbB proton channel family protein [Candidatus Lambdaproteobacteria bacterium]